MAKKERKRKLAQNSFSGSPNFSTQGESRVRAFCSLVLSNAKVRNSIKAGQKRIRRLEDSKGKQQQLVRPRLLEFEIDGGEVQKKMAVLFSSSDAGHDKRPVQGNGTASCASFRRFQPSRQAIKTKAASIPGNHSARQRQMPTSRDQNSKRNDAILTSDHLDAGEPPHAAAVAACA